QEVGWSKKDQQQDPEDVDNMASLVLGRVEEAYGILPRLDPGQKPKYL
ncbi:MAG: hypothetical protein JRC60_05320, partial [Deltaproteobacteria bacterium]|nr:hypothetical protein [Deltaproteobacteria bacterium]